MNLAQTMYLKAKWGIKDFFTKENGEVNVVAIVVLCGVAVILALFFKTQMTNLLTTMFQTLTTSTTTAITPTE